MGNFGSSSIEGPQRGRYGLKQEHSDINDKKIRLTKAKPAKNISLQEHFPEVWDQQDFATSTAHAIASVIEYDQVP